MVKNVLKRKLALSIPATIAGLLLFGVQSASAVTFSSTPAISTATFESSGAVTALVVEFNRPVWNDAALTGALQTSDFVYTDGNAAGAASITAIAHSAGDDFAILTLNADPVAGDTADTIHALANNIFTVGGAVSGAQVALSDDAGTAPAISSATFLSGAPRISVTFSKRVWTDDTSGAPPTSAPAVADFTIVDGNAGGCAPALAANLLVRPGARRAILDCGENTVAGDTADTIAAASASSLSDAWGNDMGTGTVAFTSDSTAPTIIRVEAVKDSTAVLITFSEPVFTDSPNTGSNPATVANADFTYTDGGSTGGAASIAATSAGTSQSFMLIGTGSGNSYALLTGNAAVSIADLSGGAADDTIDAAASGTAIFDANGTGMTTGGTTANRTLNDTTNPVLLSATVNVTGATGQNTLVIVYSEDVTLTGFTAGGESIASTTTVGDMSTDCSIPGFGAFAAGNIDYSTLGNTVALNAAQTTFTITFAGQTGAYRTSTGAQTACSGVLTPTTTINDLAPTPNAMVATSVLRTLTTSTAWDLANPLTAQVTAPSSVTTTSATLGWTAVTDAGTDFREYKFFYGGTTGAGASLAGTQWGRASDTGLATRTTTSTTITGLNSGTVYFVTPYVFDTFGNPVAAAELNIQTNSSQVIDRVAPAAPSGFKVESKGGKALLTWTDATDTDLRYVLILRGKNGIPVSGTPYTTVEKGVKTFTDNDTVAGDVLTYILRSRDAANNESVNSSTVSLTVAATDTPSTPSTPTTTPPSTGEDNPSTPSNGDGEPDYEEPEEVKSIKQIQLERKIARLEKKVDRAQTRLAALEARTRKSRLIKIIIGNLKKTLVKYEAQLEDYQADWDAAY